MTRPTNDTFWKYVGYATGLLILAAATLAFLDRQYVTKSYAYQTFAVKSDLREATDRIEVGLKELKVLQLDLAREIKEHRVTGK